MTAWSSPLPLITCEDNQLALDRHVADKLVKIEKPFVIVCIAGPYRTGKSYLLNRLAGKQTGFPLGSTVQAVTKGIWVWYIDHPYDNTKGLLLLDTEGLGDPARGDETYDMWILCISILLSSVFSYNVIGKIDNSLIDKLHFVTDISKHICAQTAVTEDADFDGFFPSFVLTIRDAHLQMIFDNQQITPDEYMEKMMLSARPGNTDKEIKRNNVKLKLRKYFRARKCFLFNQPTQNLKDLRRLETLTEGDLQPIFVQQSNEFCSYIFREAQIKKLNQIQPVNGRIFVHLAEIYLKAIENGSVPCVGSAVDMVAKTENSLAIEKSVEIYRNQMKNVPLPVSLEILKAAHEQCHTNALAYFMKKVFLDENNHWHQKLQENLQEQYCNFAKANCQISLDRCKTILEQLYEPMRRRCYVRPGGYYEFNRDLEKLQRDYEATDDLGIMTDAALQKFLTDRKNDQQMIMQADDLLSQSEKKIEQERLQHQLANQRAELHREELRQLDHHKQTLMEAHKEQVRLLNETYSQKLKEQAEALTEQMEAREDEHRRLLEEKFSEEARALQNQIDQLKNQRQSVFSRIVGPIVNVASTVLTFIPNPICRVAGVALGFIGGLFR